MANDLRCEDCNKDGLNSHTLNIHLSGKKHAEVVGMAAPMVAEKNDQECQVCGLTGLNTVTLAIHVESERHIEAMGMAPEDVEDRVYPADLQDAVDGYEIDPRDRAKMVRGAFAERGWPDESHPGTVRDFLEENRIPFFVLPDHVTWAEGKNYSNAASKEILRTGAFNPDKETDANKVKN